MSSIGCIAHQVGIDGVVDQLHIDFTDSTSLFPNIDFTGTITNSGYINSVRDLSPKKNDLTINTTNTAITYKNNVFGTNKPGLQTLPGNQNWLVFKSPKLFQGLTTSGFTLVVVYSVQRTNTVSTQQAAITMHSSTSASYRSFIGYQSAGQTLESIGFTGPTAVFNTTSIWTYPVGYTSIGVVYVLTGSPANGTTLYHNGSKLTLNLTTFGTTSMGLDYTIGRMLWNSGDQKFYGGIGEIRLYTGWRDPNDVRELTLTLRNKFGF